MSDARKGNGWTAMQVAVGAIAALISLAAAFYSATSFEAQSIERMRSFDRMLRIEQLKLETRVDQLEQSKPPFVPPRFPGRIGSAS